MPPRNPAGLPTIYISAMPLGAQNSEAGTLFAFVHPPRTY